MDIHADIHTQKKGFLRLSTDFDGLGEFCNGSGAKQAEHIRDPAHQRSLAAVAPCSAHICRGVWVAQWAAAEATSYMVGILIEERPTLPLTSFLENPQESYAGL